MTSIRVPDTISKLSPDDTYPIVEGKDVSGFMDLKSELNDNTSKIETNILNIKNLTKAGKTTVINNVGDSTPQWDSEPHGNYLLVQRAQTQRVTIQTPDPTGGMLDGAIFTVYNESPTQAINLIPGDSADTLNSASAVNIPPENFASFVYQLKDRDFLELESGYIPAARVNIANYVENKLSTDGKIHTEAELLTSGFLKGIQVSSDGVSNNVNGAKWIHFKGATVSQGKTDQAVITVTGDGGLTPTESILHFQTITERDQWSASDGSKYTEVVCIVDSNADGVAEWFKWSSNAWSKFNPIDLPAVTGGTLNIADAQLEVGTANKLEFLKGQMLEDGTGGVTYSPSITFSNASGSYKQFNAGTLHVHLPLKFEESKTGPNQVTPDEAVLTIAHNAFEPMHVPSFLAYLKDEEEVLGRGMEPNVERMGALWFEDVVVPSGPYIGTEMNTKSYSIEEADELDPNVTGGTSYLIAFRAHMKGKAPADGPVRIGLRYTENVGQSNPTGYVLDTEGNPMVVERHYKVGEELGVLDVLGIVSAKGSAKFQCFVTHTFDDVIELTDRTEGATGLMIQALTKDEKTGNGLLQFEADTNQNIEFSSHYLGSDRMSLGYIIAHSDTVQTYNAGDNGKEPDGFYIYTRGGIKAGVDNGYYVFQGDGINLVDFEFGKVFSAEETRMLRGKQISISLVTTTAQSAARVFVAKWTGKPDEATTPVFSGWANGNPTYSQGWAQVLDHEIVERPGGSDTSDFLQVNVPADAVNYAVFITQESPVLPYLLKIKQFEVDVDSAFVGYILDAPENNNEKHLLFDTEYKQFVQDVQGYAALRYTINNVDEGNPMPCGIPQAGAANITLDSTVNQVGGSGAKGGEGAMKFGVDGKAHIRTMLRLWNEQVSGTATTFWYVKFNPDGSSEKLPDSEFNVTVPAGAKGTQFLWVYDHDFKAGDRIGIRAKSDSVDGSFLQAVPGKPMLTASITYKELAQVGADDPFGGSIDYTQFDSVRFVTTTVTKKVQNASSVVINLDIPDSVNLSVLEAVKLMPDLSVRPVRALDWVYSNTKKTLTISFGETVLLGQVTIGLYE